MFGGLIKFLYLTNVTRNKYNNLKFKIMNKEIASSFETKFKKIAEIRNEIIEELRARLNELGEQNCIFDDDDKSAVPIYYLTDDNDEGLFHIDKIKTDEEGVIKFHDKDFDEWYRLAYLDDQAIYTLIGYIDWK